MRRIHVCIIGIIMAILSVFLICIINLNMYAFADNEYDEQSILALCKQVTGDNTFWDNNNRELKLEEYPDYITERFETSNFYNENTQIYDEWITKIVPIQLFEQKMQDFLYVGDAYGFYFDYDKSEDTFLVFFIKPDINMYSSGQLRYRVEPFYYEKYKFNQDNNLSILYYGNNSQHYFREYYKVKKLYLKDISFSGSLYNQFHLNQGEDGYIDENDNGGYFVGNRYVFSGVSTQTGKNEFSETVLKTTVGYIPIVGDVVGKATNVNDIVKGIVDYIEASSRDYRVIKSNNDDFGVELDELDAVSQIEKYGYLLKDSYTYLKTPNNENAVLLGINNGCYAQNTFLVNYADHRNKWDTLFVSQISLDIVEEENTESITDSTIKVLKTGVTSNDYYYNLNNNEEFQIDENGSLDLYILGNAELKLNFVAPVNSAYTFSGYNNEDIIVEVLNQNVVFKDLDNKLIVDLENNETCRLKLESVEGEGVYKFTINCMFTPEKLNLNVPLQRTIKPSETEYLLIYNDEGSPFDLSIISNNEVEAGLYLDNRENIIGSLLSGELLEPSYYLFDNRNYYLAIHNYSNVDSLATVELKNVNTLKMGEENTFEISDSKYFKYSPIVTSEYKFEFSSDGLYEIEIYDEDNKFLAGTPDNKAEISHLLEGEHVYNVLVKNISHDESLVKILVNPNPVNINIGSNILYQFTSENCYKLVPNISANYLISLTDNDFIIYDSQWQTVCASNGNYYLEKQGNYFIVVNGSPEEEFTLNVDLCYTTQESGIVPDSGEIVVKFIPNKSVKYEVDGAENVEWYDSNLIESGAYLIKDKVYYVKIKGQANTEYVIRQGKEYTQISVNRLVNLFEGSYTFTIQSAGNYVIMFYCGKNTVDFTLYNESGEEVCSYNAGSGNIPLNLPAGAYTFDLSVSTATSAGIIVKAR